MVDLTAEKLDMNMPIAESADGSIPGPLVPTPYLEDYLFKMLEDLNALNDEVINIMNTISAAQDLPFTAFGDLRVAAISPLLQGTFEYTVDNTALNTNTVVGTGTVAQSQGMAVVGSGAVAVGTALLQSKQHARYRAGLGGMARFTAKFTAGASGTEQLAGLAGDTGSIQSFNNGYMIGYVGTVFGFHRFQNDVLFTVPLDEWNDPLDGTGESEMTLDPTKLNVYFIQFEYLGAGPINIWVQAQTGVTPILVHTVDYANLNDVPSVFNPNFHYTMWADNGSTTSEVILRTASYGFFVEGETSLIELQQPVFSSEKKEKTGVTTEVAIFTIRNKSTYAGKTNFIDILLQRINGSIEAINANNLGALRAVKNATLGGAPSFADINTSDSVVDIDTAGTTVTGGVDVSDELLAGKNDKVNDNVRSNKLILNPGDTLTIAGSSASSATIDASVLWTELF